MGEIKVESGITGDYCVAYEKGKGIFIVGGWLEKHKALKFAKNLLDALVEPEPVLHKKDCMMLSIAEHPHCTCGATG